jgi:hypothetical protein
LVDVFAEEEVHFFDEKVFANPPTNNEGAKIVSHFICKTCLNPEQGPL